MVRDFRKNGYARYHSTIRRKGPYQYDGAPTPGEKDYDDHIRLWLNAFVQRVGNAAARRVLRYLDLEHGSNALGMDPTPYWDDWTIGLFLNRSVTSGLSFEDFYYTVNEHRLMFNRIIALLVFKANQLQLRARQRQPRDSIIFESKPKTPLA